MPLGRGCCSKNTFMRSGGQSVARLVFLSMWATLMRQRETVFPAESTMAPSMSASGRGLAHEWADGDLLIASNRPEKVDLYAPDPDHERQRRQGLQIPTGVISHTLHSVIDVVRRMLPRVHVIVRIELGELDPGEYSDRRSAPLTFSFPSPATFQAPAPNRTSSRRLLLRWDDGDVGDDAPRLGVRVWWMNEAASPCPSDLSISSEPGKCKLS
jgi:hypothetical protein